VPRALDEKDRLTARSLQDYLSEEVPLTLRKTYSAPFVQTPWKYGGESRNFQIADLTEIFKQRTAMPQGYQQLKRTLLREVTAIDVRSLSGFRKGVHHVPDYVSSATQDFVVSTSKSEVQKEFEAMFASIRETLKYKPRELISEDGGLITPDFEYTVYAKQNEAAPSEALIVEELTNIKPSIIKKPEFNSVFDGRFTELIFQFDKKVDIRVLIDQLAELDSPDVELDYNSSRKSCELSISGSELKLRFEPKELTVVSKHGRSPLELMDAFIETQKMIAGTVAAPALKA